MAKKPLEVKLLFDKVKVCVVYEPHEIRCNADSSWTSPLCHLECLPPPASPYDPVTLAVLASTPEQVPKRLFFSVDTRPAFKSRRSTGTTERAVVFILSHVEKRERNLPRKWIGFFKSEFDRRNDLHMAICSSHSKAPN
ncbi:hypothetical protein OUZ56_025063 [Daphnia magna]|uniref:Uncharacterized protein n=1 Tax=Daphnia magna TaxID=35525 RepID=A0ABQ9ZIQ8_9CRUS|nr:hypothetical protein OUZ56_025063 [Daphnia magna]